MQTHHHIKVATVLAILLDTRFRLGKIRFGIDPLLDLIPGIGVVIGLLLSLYIVWIGKEMNIPHKKIYHMLINVIIDFLLGLIPIVGALGDLFYKANMKNLRILKEHQNFIIEGQTVEG